MPISVHVFHHFGTEELTTLGAMFELQEKRLMSAATDKIAEITAAMTAKFAEVRTTLDQLNAEVTSLRAQVASAAGDPEVMTAADAVLAQIEGFQVNQAQPTTPAPGTPTPAPGEPTTPPVETTPPTMPPGVAPPPIETTPPTPPTP